jgi:hypothetical protein
MTPKAWEGAAWSAEQCRTVLHAIVNSPHAAVPVSQLQKQLGGVEALKSMNEQNLLLRRSFHEDARDMDPVAFGPRRKEVYMLPSAAHLLAARAKLDALGRKPFLADFIRNFYNFVTAAQ